MKHRITPFLAAVLLTLFHPAAALAACASPVGIEGQINYNGTYHVMQWCDNHNVWRAMDTQARAGGAGCSGPADPEGTVIYNKTYHMMQYCDGVTWRAMTGASSYNNGLVGWWKLDEGTGTTAKDSQASNNGTLTNGPTWIAGKINGALSLDTGVNAYVAVPDVAAFDIAGSWTVSEWVNPNSIPQSGTTAALLSRDNAGSASNYELMINNNNGTFGASLGWVINFNDSGLGDHYAKYTTPISVSTWYHVVGVYDSVAQTLTLYLNGVKVASSSVAGNTPVSDSGGTGLQLGAELGFRNFDGTIDDARIWNRALKASEVASLYRDTNAGACGPTGLVGWWKLDDGMSGSGGDQVGWWKFDDGTSGSTPNTAVDSSGNGNTLDMHISAGGPNWTTSGKYSNAVVLGGDDWVEAGDPPSLRLSGSWTISTWVKLSALPAAGNFGTLIGREDTSGCDDYALFLDKGHFGAGTGWVIQFNDSGSCSTDRYAKYVTTPTLGTWYHVTGVYDFVAQTLTLYLNGSQVATSSTGGSYSSVAVGDPTNAFSIGAMSTTNFLSGTMDDTRIFSRALSAAEVSALYNNTFTSKASAPPTTARDSSGNGNTGKLVNNGTGLPIWTTGKINGALAFSTTGGTAGNEVDAGYSSALQSTGSMTASAWVYVTAPPGGGVDGRIVYRGAVFALKTTADCGSQRFSMEIVNGAVATEPCSNTVVQTNTWYLVTAVYDQSVPIVHIYVNGVLDDSGMDGDGGPAPSSMITSTAHLTIGGDNATQNGFSGTIDDARVYNRALTAADVLNLYNGTDSGVEGQLMYNANAHTPQFCDGTEWHATQ